MNFSCCEKLLKFTEQLSFSQLIIKIVLHGSCLLGHIHFYNLAVLYRVKIDYIVSKKQE